MRPHRPARGFTLMEMLVVLILLGLLLSLVFDALGVFRIANDRIAARTAEQRTSELGWRWLADSVSGLRAARQPEPEFKGGADAFSGLSTQPVRGGAGVPAAIDWRLVQDADGDWLEYRQGEADPIRLRAPEGLAGFAYFDGERRWHREWPPRLGLQTPLPAAVAFVVAADGGEVLHPVAVLGPRTVVDIPYELEQD